MVGAQEVVGVGEAPVGVPGRVAFDLLTGPHAPRLTVMSCLAVALACPTTRAERRDRPSVARGRIKVARRSGPLVLARRLVRPPPLLRREADHLP